MAKVRVDLKYFRNALDLLAKDIKNLRGRAANPAARTELAALEQKLTAIQTLMADECPVVYFRNFDVTEPAAPRPAKKKKTAKPKAAKKAR